MVVRDEMVFPKRCRSGNVDCVFWTGKRGRSSTGAAMNHRLLHATAGAAIVRAEASGTFFARVPCGSARSILEFRGLTLAPRYRRRLGVDGWSVKGEYLYARVIGAGLEYSIVSA